MVFSRNSENMSAKYPDLVESIPKVRQAMNRVVGPAHTMPLQVCQQKRQDVRDRHRGSSIRYQGEETLAIPAADNTKKKRRQNGRYHCQGAYLRIRPSLSERRGKDRCRRSLFICSHFRYHSHFYKNSLSKGENSFRSIFTRSKANSRLLKVRMDPAASKLPSSSTTVSRTAVRVLW